MPTFRSVVVACLLALSVNGFVNGFQRYHRIGNTKCVLRPNGRNNASRYLRSETKLFVDIFGIGPSELIIIVAAGFFIYGPERVKNQLREKGVEGPIASKGWVADRDERIEDMQKRARRVRANRAMQRVNEAMDEGNQYVIDKVDEFTELGGS